MSEEEKRKAIEAFLAQEQQRTSSIFDHHTAQIAASLEQSARRRQLMDGLAQQGITWEDLKQAYDTAFIAGHDAMIDFRLSFFYAATAIAVKEAHPSQTPEQIADFMRMLRDQPGVMDRDGIVLRAVKETGVDTSNYDEEGTPQPASLTHNRATRKDIAAINRMKKTGITPQDLAYERDLGYQHGWNSGFNYSVCYAALALTLASTFSSTREEIESLIDRVQEIADEEISAEDILERCRQETGVDVSLMAKR